MTGAPRFQLQTLGNLVRRFKKVEKLLENVIKESNKKGFAINCKKIECMVVRKRDSWKCELHTKDVKFKQFQKFNSLGNVLHELKSIVKAKGPPPNGINCLMFVTKASFKLKDIGCSLALSGALAKFMLHMSEYFFGLQPRYVVGQVHSIPMIMPGCGADDNQ